MTFGFRYVKVINNRKLYAQRGCLEHVSGLILSFCRGKMLLFIMRYEGEIYRPPSEANSLILQVTIGCSHNRCSFCNAYLKKNFRERELDEIFADVDYVGKINRNIKRIFLADGNALTMDKKKLLALLEKLYNTFPGLERVSSYANPHDLLHKSVQDLKEIKEAGLTLVYLGVETGNHDLLQEINKGVSRSEMIEAGQKARGAGMKLSVTVINGLGGKELIETHARDTATLLNQVEPEYLGLLTLMVEPGTSIARQVEQGEFVPLDSREVLEEIELMLKDIDLKGCIFRSNHASNYLPLRGTLSEDKNKLLEMIDRVLRGGETQRLRPEIFRGL